MILSKEEIRKKCEEFARSNYKRYEIASTEEQEAKYDKLMEEIVDYFYGIINKDEWE